MQRFDSKTAAEQVLLSVILSAVTILNGTTINLADSATRVLISQYLGPTADPNPSAMLLGSPTINSQPIVVGNTTYPPYTVLSQLVGGGVLNATYKLEYQMRLSTQEIVEEDCLISVVSAVP